MSESRSNDFLASLTSAADLERQHFPEVAFVLDGLLPVGLSALVAKPKAGKSWLVLDLLLAQAAGGEFLGQEFEESDVLYLALEDNGRRLQQRMQQILPAGGFPERLQITNQAPMLGEGLEDAIRVWAGSRLNPRLVVIDTMAKVFKQVGASRNEYIHTTQELGRLQRLAFDLDIAVLLVHHVNKETINLDDPNFDPFNLVLGSTAIVGVMDAVLVIDRRRFGTEGTMLATGRDIDEVKIGLNFNKETGIWHRGGRNPLDELDIQQVEREVIEAMHETGLGTTGDLTKHLSKKHPSSVSSVWPGLIQQGLVTKARRGEYALTEAARKLFEEVDDTTPLNAATDTAETNEITEEVTESDVVDPITNSVPMSRYQVNVDDLLN